MKFVAIFKLVGSFIGYLLLCPLASAAPLTLAIADLPSFSTALIAEDQGFFAAEGLELKTIHGVNGVDADRKLTSWSRFNRRQHASVRLQQTNHELL